MKPKNFQVEIKPFGFVVQVVVADSVNHCIDYCNKYTPITKKMEKEDRFKSFGGAFFQHEKYSFIFLTKNSTVHDLVHESFHAIMHESYDRGAKFSRKSEEFFAYSLGEFVETLTEEFTKAIK